VAKFEYMLLLTGLGQYMEQRVADVQEFGGVVRKHRVNFVGGYAMQRFYRFARRQSTRSSLDRWQSGSHLCLPLPFWIGPGACRVSGSRIPVGHGLLLGIHENVTFNIYSIAPTSFSARGTTRDGGGSNRLWAVPIGTGGSSVDMRFGRWWHSLVKRRSTNAY
jgi:hypothetical protein